MPTAHPAKWLAWLQVTWEKFGGYRCQNASIVLGSKTHPHELLQFNELCATLQCTRGPWSLIPFAQLHWCLAPSRPNDPWIRSAGASLARGSPDPEHLKAVTSVQTAPSQLTNRLQVSLGSQVESRIRRQGTISPRVETQGEAFHLRFIQERGQDFRLPVLQAEVTETRHVDLEELIALFNLLHADIRMLARNLPEALLLAMELGEKTKQTRLVFGHTCERYRHHHCRGGSSQ